MLIEFIYLKMIGCLAKKQRLSKCTTGRSREYVRETETPPTPTLEKMWEAKAPNKQSNEGVYKKAQCVTILSSLKSWQWGYIGEQN